MSPVGIILTDVNGSLGIGRYAGSYRIASEYRTRGQQVRVIDHMMSFTIDELIAVIDALRGSETQWVGISSTFLASKGFDPFSNRVQIREQLQKSTSVGWDIDSAERLFAYCRSVGLRIIIGGARQKHEFSDVEWIAGNAEGQLHQEPFEFNTSTIAWDEHDYIFDGEHLPIEIARGCIFKCSFCSYNLNGKKLWDFCKSSDVVEQEMRTNYDRWGTTGYMFSDDTYNDSPIKVKAFRDMFVSLPFDIEFTTYARLDLILTKWETMEMLAQSGMKSVFFGIESLNRASGKSVGKGMDPDRIKEGLLRIKREYPDIIICTGFIAGLPHETIDSLTETIAWLEDSPIDSYSYQVLSLGASSSDMSLNAEKYGYKFDQNGSWYNEHMTYHDAVSLAESASRGTIGAFTFYSRLRNLGYSEKQVRLLGVGDQPEIQRRTNNRISEYKRKLLG